MNFEIIIISMWIIPILGFIIFKTAKNHKKFKIICNCILAFLSLLTILGLFLNITTTNQDLDWVFLTIPYLLFFNLIWGLKSYKNKILRVIGVVCIFFFIFINYFLSTIGILGIGFIINEYTPSYKTTFDNQYNYKEITLGNALSDHRGKKIEIHQKVKWLPFIEIQKLEKNYNSIASYSSPFKREYIDSNKKLILSSTCKFGDSIYIFNDTIFLK